MKALIALVIATSLWSMEATPIGPKKYLAKYSKTFYVQEWCIDGYKWLHYRGYRAGSFSQKFKKSILGEDKALVIRCSVLIK